MRRIQTSGQRARAARHSWTRRCRQQQQPAACWLCYNCGLICDNPDSYACTTRCITPVVIYDQGQYIGGIRAVLRCRPSTLCWLIADTHHHGRRRGASPRLAVAGAKEHAKRAGAWDRSLLQHLVAASRRGSGAQRSRLLPPLRCRRLAASACCPSPRARQQAAAPPAQPMPRTYTYMQ